MITIPTTCRIRVGRELSALSVGDWLWDCQWLTDDPSCLCHSGAHEYQLMSADDAGDGNQLNISYPGDRYHLAAVLGHNSVALCCWWSMSVLQRVCCSESCILYLLCCRFFLVSFVTYFADRFKLLTTQILWRGQSQDISDLDLAATRNLDELFICGMLRASASLNSNHDATMYRPGRN